ncbi:hypothetical protein KC316_g5680 [Hortaea werneckii]|nr:hypothetical protein KC324_g10873 [Hortaea werneckii]KAI7586300.1 hypothetical protein KC316_g5680 [Hortaea werneckii]
MARAEAARAAADAAAAAGGPADEPADEPVDEPANEPADEAAHEAAHEPADEAADEPADERADEPTDEPGGEPAHDSADEATDELAGESAGQVEDEELDLSTSASNREDNPTGSKRKSDEDTRARGPKRPRTSHQSDQASGDGEVGNSASRQDSRPEADEQDTGEETARLSNEALQDEIDDLVRGHVLRAVHAQQAQADHQSDPVRVASEASSEARYPPLPADVASRPADEAAEIESTKKLGYMEAGSVPEEWNFVECIGTGTFGRACLWVKRNNTHTIIDRAVIKENYLETIEWADDLNWGDNRVPWEACRWQKTGISYTSALHMVGLRGDGKGSVPHEEWQCYWCPKNSPSPGEQTRVGINTNNVDPEVLRFVDRKYDFSILKRPVREKGTAHPDDLADY